MTLLNPLLNQYLFFLCVPSFSLSSRVRTENGSRPYQNDLTIMGSAEVVQDGWEPPLRPILQQQGTLLGKHNQLLRSANQPAKTVSREALIMSHKLFSGELPRCQGFLLQRKLVFPQSF